MSIMYELYKSIGKRPCPPGTVRIKRCSMVLNEDSEDLLVSNTFGLLKYLSPALWLVPLLEAVFKDRGFKAIAQSKMKVTFWEKISSPPTRYQEGIEEIDIMIRVRHMILLIECKFKSSVQREKVNTRDQIARYFDAIVFNHWPDDPKEREIYLILLTDTKDEPVILSQYRNPDRVLASLTQVRPFLDYEEVSRMLARNLGWATWSDLLRILSHQDLKKVDPIQAMIVQDVIKYMKHKFG